MSTKIKTFTVKSLPKDHHPHQVKPFLRWVGGKQKLVGSLLERLPKADSYDRYFEPFLGAGSLFLAHGFRNAVLNDLNAHLINCYKQIEENPTEVYYSVRNHVYSLLEEGQGYYYRVREEYNSSLDELTRAQAARFIFLIHANYKGIFRVNRGGRYNTPFGKSNPSIPSLDHLMAVQYRLRGAELRSGDFRELEPLIGDDSFVYLDPPYPVWSSTANFTQYTALSFAERDHIELAEFVHRIHAKGAKVMISISGTPLVKALYRKSEGWRYHSTSLKRTLSAKNDPLVVEELILTNYTPVKS